MPDWLDQPWIVFLGVLGFHAVGVLHVGLALMHTRTSQGAIAWIVSLVAFPYVAIPCYWIFGRQRFHGYVEARRAGDKRFAAQMGDLLRGIARFEVMPGGPHAGFLDAARRLADFPILAGNKVALLTDGPAVFDSMFRSVEEARHYVLVFFFIFKNDRVGREFKDLLERKAREGVRVFFLSDSLGSRALSSAFIREMRMAGVRVESFGANRHWWSRFQINFRNHRKLVVVDGRAAHVGGLNVGDEYRDGHPELGPWRDTHLRIDGPAVDALQMMFLEDWHWATGEIPELSWSGDPQHEDQRVLVLPTGPNDPYESWRLAVVGAAASATRRLWIASPYFVPDEAVTAALQSAALRGVDVRILLPDKPDHLLVYLSSFSYYQDTLPYGVGIHRYRIGFMHQKVVLVDSDLAIVGSANLDNRSFRLNFEISCVLDDARAATAVAAMLKKDFRQSRAVALSDFTARPLWFRLACRAARLLAPVQ